MSDALTGRILLDEQNPWPGPAAYDEASQAFFHGRENDAGELLRLVRKAPLCVLYGASGLGKSSLLQAGLFPLLRAGHYLPVYVKVDFTPGAEMPALEQVAYWLEQEVARVGAECPARAAGEDLWQYLHRRDLEIWSADNHLLTPVLVLDQFEEVFTRGGGYASVDAIFHDLADLIENRIPAEWVDGDRERRARLDLLAQRYHVVLAFREDFLPEMETWKGQVPSLLRNFLRLRPMSRAQAIAATEQAGAAVLEAGVAGAIVDLVAHREGQADSIEPVLLSLCCTQLNRRRAPDNRIDRALVERAGQDILEGFYRDAIAGMPDRVPQFIETHLIQGDRYRGSYPRDEALTRGDLTAEELAVLTDRFRLLRIDQMADTARIELIHDRLVSVVRTARDARRSREHALEQQRRLQAAEEEAQHERQLREQAEHARARLVRLRNGLLLVAVMLLGAMVYAYRSEQLAHKTSQRATSLKLIVEAQSVLNGALAGGDERAMLQVLAAYRVSPSTHLDTGPLNSLLARRELKRLIAHSGKVSCVAISPDGRRIISGSRDGSLRLWDGQTGQPVGTPMHGHMDIVWGVAFSPDGRRIVSGSNDHTLRLWDAQTGQSIGAPLAGHSDAVDSVAFSPDGSRIVSGSLDQTVRLWDARTGQPVGTPLAGHTRGVNSVAFSPNGHRIVTGSDDHTLRLWDARTGRPIGSPLKGHQDWVMSVAFSPDSRSIVSGSDDRTLRLWDAQTSQPIGKPLTLHAAGVSSVAFSSDGHRIVSGSRDHTLRLWDAQTRQPIGEPFKGHTDTVWSVAFSPDGKRLISGSDDQTVRIWDAQRSQPRGALLNRHTSWVKSAAYSPDGRRIVSGSDDQTLRLWDAQTGQPIGAPMTGHTKGVNSVAFSPDGNRLASGSDDQTLRLWNAQTGQPIGTPMIGHTKGVKSVAFSPDGNRLVSGSVDHTLRLWDAQTGQPVGTPLEGHKDVVRYVAFSQDGRRIVSGSMDHTLRLWDAKTSQPIGKPLTLHADGVSSVAFSPDGHRIVSGSFDHTLRLWDTVTGQPIGVPMHGHKASVLSVAFNPDGRHIVSGSEDGTLRLWDAQSGLLTNVPLVGHKSWVHSVAFSPDGLHIVSASHDKTLIVWDTLRIDPWPAPGAWTDELCAKLSRNMSRRQWADWVGPDIPYSCQCPGLPVAPDDPKSAVNPNMCSGKPSVSPFSDHQ